MPPIAFAILFGLFMDYMVFLMSRIREEHVHGLKTREAVEHGIAAIGRVVVAAALIMGTVFAAFILTSDRISKEFGLLLAVAILTDALVVKMTLVPAFFTLARREDVVHAALARQDPAEHHDRASARPGVADSGGGPARGADGSLTRGGRSLRAPPASRRNEAVEPVSDGGCDRREVGTQAVIAGDRHDRSRREPGGIPNRSRSPWTTSTGTWTASSSGEPALRGLAAGAARRQEREREAEDADRARRLRRSGTRRARRRSGRPSRAGLAARTSSRSAPRPRATPRRAGGAGAGLLRPATR